MKVLNQSLGEVADLDNLEEIPEDGDDDADALDDTQRSVKLMLRSKKISQTIRLMLIIDLRWCYT